MEIFDFYQFIGVLAPGSVFLIAIALLYDVPTIKSVLAPDSFGGLGAHLILAYITGQLLQVIANGIERVYWFFWGGLPSEWPITRPKRKDFSKAVQIVCQALGQREPKGNDKEKLADWHRLIAQVRSTIYANDRAKRLDVFNANYGLLRGVLANILLLAALVWGRIDWWPVAYPILGILAILATLRMHRFSVYYAEELFANAAELARENEKDGPKTEK